MNKEKDKLMDKLKKMKETAQKLVVEKPCDKLDEIQNDISNGYITAINEINDYIQQGNGKKTNLDIITETHEKLMNFIELASIAGMGYEEETGTFYFSKQVKDNISHYLSQKVGE